MSDVSEILTSQNIQETDNRVYESEMDVRNDRLFTDEFWQAGGHVYEINQKIKDKEAELIILYKMMLSCLDTTTDEEQKRDLKKDVQEKIDFLETRVDIHRSPKRQKLEEGIDNAGTKLPDQAQLLNDVTLLLVGSAGNGKSATGNSIIGRQVFKTTASTTSQSSETKIESGKVNNLEVRVVDGPGVDTDKSTEELLRTSIETIEKALKLCDYRFSALLVVLKYGARFTKQESDFIKTVKGILGKNVIRDYGVCIITHGDNFDVDNEDESLNFQEWCQQQEGQIKDLFEECNYRCVLFNNRTKDSNIKDLQITQLLEFVSKEKNYSEKEFSAAFKDMQKLIIETKAPKILEDTKIFISKIKIKMGELASTTDTNKQIMSYKELLKDVNVFEQELLENYGDPDNIKQSHLEVKVLRMEINNKLKTCYLMKQTEENAQRATDKESISPYPSLMQVQYQSKDEENNFVFVGNVAASCHHDHMSLASSTDIDTGMHYEGKRFLTETGDEEIQLSGLSQNGVFEGRNVSQERSQPHHIALIYQRVYYYKTQIDSMKYYNSPREEWNSLKSNFETEEKCWNIDDLGLSITDVEILEEKIFAIKGMFSQYMPKSGNAIWELVKSYLPSFDLSYLHAFDQSYLPSFDNGIN